jgi:TrmH family RNA methyltransferase
LRIASRHNLKYRQWKRLAAYPEAEDCPWLPVEGWKQIADLGKLSIELLLFSDAADPRLTSLMHRARCCVELDGSLLRGLSSVGAPQGVLAFFAKPVWEWRRLTPYLLYCHRLQDPGNLGTLLRTARATGIFSVVTSPDTVSFYNSKVIRSSASALFELPHLSSVRVEELFERGFRLWTAKPSEGVSLFKARFQAPLAILVGNEGSGLDALPADTPAQPVHIPMQPGVESLNAAVAGSLMLYEVYRREIGHE